MQRTIEHEEANSAFNKGDYLGAIKLYEQAIAIQPTNAILYSNMCQCYLNLGYFEYAFFEGAKAIRLDNTHMKSFSRICTALENMKGCSKYDAIITLVNSFGDKAKLGEKNELSQILSRALNYVDSRKYKSEMEKDELNGKLCFASSPLDNLEFTKSSIDIQALVEGKPEQFGKIQIRDIHGKGRGMFAKEDIKEGDIICSEEAIFSISLEENACFHCIKILPEDDPQFKCTSCPMKCCSKRCFDVASQYHTCGTQYFDTRDRMRQTSISSSSRCLLAVSKYLLYMRVLVNNPEDPIFERSTSALDSLVHLRSMPDGKRYFFLDNERRRYESTVMCSHVVPLYRTWKLIDRKVMTNSWSISYKGDPYYGDKFHGNGTATYHVLSMCNHDCNPNSEMHWDQERTGSFATLIATRNIKSGEEITVSYVGYDTPKEEKQMMLSIQYGFICNCEKCK